jgi:hypothetical protein
VIPENFCKNWITEIVKHKTGWVCGKDYATMVIFHLSDTPKYLSSGCQVAKQFGFTKPTKVVLKYEIENNLFEMKVLPKHHQQMEVPQIIEIDDSDDEAYPDVNVTPIIPRSKKQRTTYDQNRIQPKVVVFSCNFFIYLLFNKYLYFFFIIIFYLLFQLF